MLDLHREWQAARQNPRLHKHGLDSKLNPGVQLTLAANYGSQTLAKIWPRHGGLGLHVDLFDEPYLHDVLDYADLPLLSAVVGKWRV